MEHDGDDLIHGRKFIRCPSTNDWSVPELLRECPSCGAFLLYCCTHKKRPLESPRSRVPTSLCHHYRVIFTDGACTNNGRPGAKAGVGVAYGTEEDCQLSEPITDIMDNFPVRSNQRAELCAAKLGIRFFAETPLEPTTAVVTWIIATDSEYVVKGMTEWLPKWKKNRWRTSKGSVPENLDLFLALDREMAIHEARNVEIKLWHITREHNKLADSLAKAAAVHGDEASMLAPNTRQQSEAHGRELRTKMIHTWHP